MVGLISSETNSAHYLALPSSYWELHWYAAYTNANHERRVAEHLTRRSVENFLPLYQSVRRWKDRRVQLLRPVFPGYVFVRLALHDRLLVLQVPGVAKLVGFNGTPTALSQKEMDALRTSLSNGVRAAPHPFLTVGRRVRVKSGPLAGMEGILERKKNSARIVISVELIRRAMGVEVEEVDLEPM
jgi:transcription antitermination factor NusG